MVTLSDEVPGWGQVLQSEVADLQADLAEHTQQNRATHKELFTRTERPPWLVVWAMGIMGSMLGGLIVYVATN